ncbi:porin [Cupriavidus sp. BIS7]|uniref:porin n=1 Tax=Cupriavidus sp. BIS7 TaxID=1217718 RepID=UPI0002EDD314|nr:porin [Cupriavidus sp. BIS7]
MKKNRLALPALGALASALCIGGAHAQSSTSVTLYGLVDTGIEFLNHAGANGSGSQYRISSGNVTGSRWGLRGREDLGGGLGAVFVLESGFNNDTGTSGQGGRLFGRQAYVGLQGDWGLISLGRQNNTLYDLFVPLDPVRYTSYGLLAQDAQFANRADNVIKYTGNFGDLTVTGMYSAGYDATIANGSEVPGNPRIGQEIGAGTSYTIGRLGMVLAYDQRRGTTAGSQGNIERRYATGLLWSDGPFTATVGYRFLQGTIATPSLRAHLYWIGGSYNFTPAFVVRAGVYRADLRNSPNDAMNYAVAMAYSLSKRTDLYLNASYMDNKGASTLGVVNGGTVAPGVNQTGVVAGVKHIF